MESLRGKVAVVTGAASGIGAAVTTMLAASGAKVVAVDVNGDGARTLAARAEGEILPVEADVSEETGVEAYTSAGVERFGRIDLYHLNAGIAGEQTSFADATAADFDRVMAVNVRGVFLGLREAFRRYAAQDTGGSIVVSASICSFGGGADLVAYHTSKHAIVGLMRAAAVTGGPIGVRVNAVAPGIVPTNLLGSAAPAARRRRRERPSTAGSHASTRLARGDRKRRRVPPQRRRLLRHGERLLGRRWRERRQPRPASHRLNGSFGGSEGIDLNS